MTLCHTILFSLLITEQNTGVFGRQTERMIHVDSSTAAQNKYAQTRVLSSRLRPVRPGDGNLCVFSVFCVADLTTFHSSFPSAFSTRFPNSHLVASALYMDDSFCAGTCQRNNRSTRVERMLMVKRQMAWNIWSYCNSNNI